MAAPNITSKCSIAIIELDDAMILPHAANLMDQIFGRDNYKRRCQRPTFDPKHLSFSILD
jgi:hypothetical protein